MRSAAGTAYQTDTLPQYARSRLQHLPGPDGHWLTGNLRQLLPNPGAYLRSQRAEYGDCFSVGMLRNARVAVVLGAEANQQLLLDPEKTFSSRGGWEVVWNFFPGNVLVRDFDDHRRHRQLLTGLFKARALEGYLQAMHPVLRRTVDSLHGEVDAYTAMKRMALIIALKVFAGFRDEQCTDALYTDLKTILDGVMEKRIPLPGFAWQRALKARDRIRVLLASEIAQRRRCADERTDMFSQLIAHSNDTEVALTDAEITDHMLGMLFAAHDTTASAMAVMLQKLAVMQQWQTRLRAEAMALPEQPQLGDCARMEETEWVLREVLRMYAPVQLLPRRTLRACELGGQRLPANTQVFLVMQGVHFDPDIYPSPERFEPARFADSSRIARFGFVPFGGGAHMCIGMHFATLEVRAFMHALLRRRRIEPVGDAPVLEYLPVIRPQQPMRLRFV